MATCHRPARQTTHPLIPVTSTLTEIDIEHWGDVVMIPSFNPTILINDIYITVDRLYHITSHGSHRTYALSSTGQTFPINKKQYCFIFPEKNEVKLRLQRQMTYELNPNRNVRNVAARRNEVIVEDCTMAKKKKKKSLHQGILIISMKISLT